MWVQPQSSSNEKDLSSKWIDYCWETKIAKQIALLTKANSPISTDITKIAASEVPKPLQNLLLANPEIFNKSEFLTPLSKTTTQDYNSFFEEMKVG